MPVGEDGCKVEEAAKALLVRLFLRGSLVVEDCEGGASEEEGVADLLDMDSGILNRFSESRYSCTLVLPGVESS